MKKLLILYLIIICNDFFNHSLAQRNANYDEAKIAPYALPQLLIMRSGQTISDKADWEGARRAEILEDFEKNVYGKTPGEPVEVDFKLLQIDENALGGTAVKKEILAVFQTDQGKSEMNILLYLPKDA